jgi:uncharacterized protein (DUF1330 family)
MTVYVVIHTTVDDTETHHREIVPKIMEAVGRHGGKRIALGHGDQLRVHEGEPPVYNRVVIHEFPSAEAAEAWAEELRQRRDQLHTLGDLSIVSVPAI